MSMPVKICGITRTEDALVAARLGAWAIGFVFHPESPRYVRPERAAEITRALGPGTVTTVGVFVDATLEEITDHVGRAGLTAVQLHGSEPPELCRALKKAARVEVFKAIRPRVPADLDALAGFDAADAILVDAPPLDGDDARGGTGRLSNWALARAAKAHGAVILSGGLTSANVYEAIGAVQPYAVDVSSGVEDSPGVKSAGKLTSFFHSLKGKPHGANGN